MNVNRAKRVAFGALVALFAAGLLRAGTVVPPGDPTIVVRDPDESGGGHPIPTALTSNFFQFTAGLGPLGAPCTLQPSLVNVQDCQFLNDTGQDWSQLFISIAPISLSEGIITCQDVQLNGFSTCIPLSGPGASPANFVFLGGGGIPMGTGFGFDLVGWDPGTVFSVSANVPEPGEGLLLAAAFTGFWLRRRRAGPA